MASRISAAVLPHPFAVPTLNTSVDFTCESDGLPLSSCFWARTTTGGQRQVVLLENGVKHDPVDGVDYLSDKISEGVCGVSISSVQENHYGNWSCTVVATEGRVLTGNVEVRGTPPSLLLLLLQIIVADLLICSGR